MALVKQNSWLFFPSGPHCNLSRQWQAASGLCQLAHCFSLSFGEQEHRYFWSCRRILAWSTKKKANLWQWFHTEGKEDFNITGFPNFQTQICPFKMDLRQLSVSMDIWNSSPFPRVNSKSVKGIQWQNFEYWNIIHSALMHLLSPSPWGTTILQLFIFGDGWLGQFFCNSVYNYRQEKLLFTV